ncbi:response regulator [Vibrio sp. TBV020]|uniref:response regulator n=1 Tax=Vibrio sp. TBV020 TaxID=3137398 RepID=UPI0038CD7F9F
MNSIKALILDNQPIVRHTLISMVNSITIQTDTFQSNSIKDAHRILREQNIDMIILDVDFNDGNGLDFIQRIRKGGYKGKVLFVSSNSNPLFNHTAKNVGANGYVLKTEDTSLINDAILAVYRGYSVFKHCSTSMHEFPDLSERESVVFSYLSKGYSNKKISELLSLSSKTISTYKSRILEKYNANSIIEIMELQRA